MDDFGWIYGGDIWRFGWIFFHVMDMDFWDESRMRSRRSSQGFFHPVQPKEPQKTGRSYQLAQLLGDPHEIIFNSLNDLQLIK